MAQWLIQKGGPNQVDTAKEIEEENTMNWTTFSPLDEVM
jgi:hypothetical protein